SLSGSQELRARRQILDLALHDRQQRRQQRHSFVVQAQGSATWKPVGKSFRSGEPRTPGPRRQRIHAGATSRPGGVGRGGANRDRKSQRTSADGNASLAV